MSTWGRELYATQPTFRATLDRCEALYRAYTGESLLAVLYPEQKTEDRRQKTEDRRQKTEDRRQAPDLDEQSKIKNQKSKIDDTTYTQPALFALEYALATCGNRGYTAGSPHRPQCGRSGGGLCGRGL